MLRGGGRLAWACGAWMRARQVSGAWMRARQVSGPYGCEGGAEEPLSASCIHAGRVALAQQWASESGGLRAGTFAGVMVAAGHEHAARTELDKSSLITHTVAPSRAHASRSPKSPARTGRELVCLCVRTPRARAVSGFHKYKIGMPMTAQHS